MTEKEFRSRDDTAKTQAEPLMQFFETWPSANERAHDQVIKIMGNEFYRMAQCLVSELPRNPERTTALRKLLEARDCAMRAAVMK